MTRSNVPLPVLSDECVFLRPAEPRDVPAIEAGIRDPDVIRWIGPQLPSAHDVMRRDEEWWEHGSPTLSICELDGTCVGKVWLTVPETDTSTGFVGYWLLPVGRGRGMATSAVRLLSTWARDVLEVTNVRLRTAPDNLRSQRVAERSGFRRLSPADDESPRGRDDREIVYALDGPLPGDCPRR
jgi:RimJ/RimL family protein N-acetyltransferase